MERAIRYVRDSFWAGRQFTTLAECNRQALLWRDQEDPPSLESSMRPLRPARQLTLEPGGEIKRGLEIARVTPREAALLKLDTALGGGCGAGGAATAPFTFFGFSIWFRGLGPGTLCGAELY